MRIDVEELMWQVGYQEKYQIWIVFLSTLSWIYLNIISVSLPYLEKTSLVKVYNNSTGESIITNLNYSLCKDLTNIQYVSRSKHSWVIEYNIECNEIDTGLIGTTSFIGVMIGSLVFQYLADRLGRRTTIAVGGFGYSIILICFNFAVNIYYIYVFNFLLQIFAYFAILGVYLYTSEISAPQKRSLYGGIINGGYCIGGVLYTLGYRYIKSWLLIFNFTSGISFTCTTIFLLFSVESPRFLFTEGKLSEMYDSLNYIGRINSKPSVVEERNMNVYAEIQENLQKKASVISLLKYSSQRTIFLVMCYIWFSTSGIYYGLTINIKNLPGNLYINGIYFFCLEFVGYTISMFLINFQAFGRKKSMLIYQGITVTASLIQIILNPTDLTKTIISFVIFFGLSGMYNINYTYSNEVYPTVVRAVGFGMNSVCARISNLLFPMLLEILQEKIMIIFCFLSLFAFLLILLLPETYGKVMANNIPELQDPVLLNSE